MARVSRLTEDERLRLDVGRWPVENTKEIPGRVHAPARTPPFAWTITTTHKLHHHAFSHCFVKSSPSPDPARQGHVCHLQDVHEQLSRGGNVYSCVKCVTQCMM
eukprot:scaffold29230_cov55-Phaeocystis_antarctica.AAC.3